MSQQAKSTSPQASARLTPWLRIRPVLARTAKAVLRAVDHGLHPFRRRAAQTRLERLAPIQRIMVLCYGNICRSPYAAAVLDRALRDRGIQGQVLQGGFFGAGRPANERALSVAQERGTDLSSHSSRVVSREEAHAVDLVVVMERWQALRVIQDFGVHSDRVLLLGDLDSDPVQNRAILDPYGHDRTVFSTTYDRIDRCTIVLAELIQRPAPAPPV